MDRSNQKICEALSRFARKRRWAKTFDLGLPDSDGRRVRNKFPATDPAESINERRGDIKIEGSGSGTSRILKPVQGVRVRNFRDPPVRV